MHRIPSPDRRRLTLALSTLWAVPAALPFSAPALAQHEGHGTTRAAPAASARKARPALAMSAAFAPDGRLWIAALDTQGRLFTQTSADEGRRWDAPRLLNHNGESISADGENRPKLAFGPDGVVVIAYTRPLAKPYSGEIRLLRSGDGGASFEPPYTVHRDRQEITHRFESIAFDAHGALHAVWIDKRDLEAAKAAGREYRGAAIYHAVSMDGGRSFGPDRLLAAHSCECCRIALSPAPDGGLAALWRHVFEPNERDHGFALLGATLPDPGLPMRASFDRWRVDACPHHGPGLTPALGGGYHAVWFGERAGVAAVRYARLAADGAPSPQVQVLPDEGAEHADVLSAEGRLAIVWRSFDGRHSRLRAWLSEDDGRSFRLRDLARSTLDNDHPRLARRGRQLYALWRDTEGVHVHALFA